jgi:hypothetical protein
MDPGRTIGGRTTMRLIAVILIGVLAASFSVCRGRVTLPSAETTIGRASAPRAVGSATAGCITVEAAVVARAAVAVATGADEPIPHARPSDDPDRRGIDLARIERPPSRRRA